MVASHGVVDFFSALLIPIMSVMEGRLSMSPGQGAALIAVGSICSGLIQPLVAMVSDRFDTRWLGTLGLLVAAGAVGSIGFARTFPELLALQAIGAAGVGAFHPVGAAAAGHIAGARRAQAIAAFFFTGLAGGVAGSILSPPFVRANGVPALAWFILPALPFALALAWAIHGEAHVHHGARAAHGALDPAARRHRWAQVWFLYAANVLRYLVNMALVQLVIRWCEQEALRRAAAEALTPALRLDASRLNGPRQAMMALGMGLAGLLLGMIIPRARERVALILVPAAGALAVGAYPFLAGEWGGVVGYALAFLAGVGFFGVIPITVTRAQRLLPHRTSLASGLMMGGSWCVAAAGPPGVQALLDRGMTLGMGFVGCGVMLFASGVLGLALDRVPPEASEASRT